MEIDKQDYEWHRIPEAGAKGIEFLRERQIRPILVEGYRICIVRNKGKLFAVTSRCPHQGGNMASGFLDETGNEIICPLHRFQFSLESGKNTSGEGFFLAHYPLEIRESGMYIGFKRGSSGSSW